MMELDQRLMQKYSTLYGLIYGVILLVLSVSALYWLAVTSAIAVIIAYPIIKLVLFPVLMAIPFILRLRKKAGGFWVLRQAASAIFVMFFTAFLVYSLGSFIYLHHLDKGINVRVTKNVMTVTSDFANRQGVQQEEIDEKMNQMRESMETGENPSIGRIAQDMIFTIIIIFVAALIFAAIFKREPSIFEQTEE